MLKKIGALVSIKFLNLMLMIIFNFLLLRYFSLAEIGSYYLMATIAYIGNALIFVGADVHLQSLTADLPTSKSIDKAGVVRYMSSTALIGMFPALLVAIFYYAWLDERTDWLLFSAVATSNCVAIYFGSVVRNLSQNAGFAYISMAELLLENSIKCIGMVILIAAGYTSGMTLVLVSTGSILFSAAIFWVWFFSVVEHKEYGTYLGSIKNHVEKLLTIGFSGILSWGQLQAYRLTGFTGQKQLEAVGAVSFLTTLGQAGASAGFAILDQFQKTKLYQSRGGNVTTYLIYCSGLGVVLALLSWPAALAFVYLAGKDELSSLTYLVPLGVLIEYGNAVFGLCMHYLNVRRERLVLLLLPSIMAFGVVMLLMFSPLISDLEIHVKIAISLVSGQIIIAAVPALIIWRLRRIC